MARVALACGAWSAPGVTMQVWLPHAPALLSGLQRPEQRVVKQLLINLGLNFPQVPAVFNQKWRAGFGHATRIGVGSLTAAPRRTAACRPGRSAFPEWRGASLHLASLTCERVDAACHATLEAHCDAVRVAFCCQGHCLVKSSDCEIVAVPSAYLST